MRARACQCILSTRYNQILSQWRDWFEAAVLAYVSWDSGLPSLGLLKFG